MSEITMDLRLVFKIPEFRLTINGLIQGLRESSAQIHGAILQTLMKAPEGRVIEKIMQKHPKPFMRNGHQSKPRKLKCCLGEIPYRFAQLWDQQKGRTLIPLPKALALPAHDHYLEEAAEPAVGLAVHVSFRRAASEVKRIQCQSMSHSTVHSRLQEFAQYRDPFGNLKATPFRFLLVDGTKVRLQGVSGKDRSQVPMRWALASLGSSFRFEPVGF